jgi:hypothetical protein
MDRSDSAAPGVSSMGLNLTRIGTTRHHHDPSIRQS